MLYNQSNQWNGIPMPLLMGFTPSTKIQEIEKETPIIYDPVSQTVFNMRTVGTKCLKTSGTQKGDGKTSYRDSKNEIDDSKNV